MKIFREGIIVLVIYLLCDVLSKNLHLPIPGNILGMVVLFILLMIGWIKIDHIETVSQFFLDHLAFFFVPAGVGLMKSFASISNDAVKIVIIVILSTIIVMATTGVAVQTIARMMNKRKNNKSNI